jgi:PTH1 family peptidyl-tRNA hydrolase
MKLIAGLGNPGKYYVRNRHNVGFRCINHIARQYSIQLKRHQYYSQIGIGKIVESQVLLAKPKTFVNLSGEAINHLMRKHHISREELIVIVDDLDLPLGKVRLRQSGRSGGHKGIKSIIAALGGEDFSRVRIGIGRPEQELDNFINREDVINHVLSDFSSEEEKIIKSAITTATEAIECILVDGMTAAMNKFN